MSLIEFIGFIISFIAMIVLFFRRTIERRRQAQNPEYYEQLEQRKEANLREMLRALDVQYEPRNEEDEDEEEEDDLPSSSYSTGQPATPYSLDLKKPRRSVRDEFQYRSKMESYKPQTVLEKRRLQTNIEERYKSLPFGAHIVSSDMEEEMEGHSNPYSLQKVARKNRINQVLAGLDSKKDIILMQEVIGPPKALR